MGLDNCCDKPSLVMIIQGEDKIITVKLNQASTGYPVDVTGADEIEARLLNADGTILSKTLTGMGIVIVSGPGGSINILIDASDSALLKPSDPQNGIYNDLEIILTIEGKISIVNMQGALSVIAPLIPLTP